MHTSPLAQPGAGDSGGMNVYVRELVVGAGPAGVRTDVYVRPCGRRRAARGGRRRARVPRSCTSTPDRPTGQGEARRGGRRVHRRRWASTSRRRLARTPTPSTPTTGCRAWPATGSSTSCRCRWCRRSTRWPGQGRSPASCALPSRPGAAAPRPRSSAAPTPSSPRARPRRTQLVQLYGAERQRIEIVAPGVDHAFFSPASSERARQAVQLRTGHPVLLFVGRIQPLKGVDRGRGCPGRAASCRPTADPGALLVVVGGASGQDGPAEQVHVRSMGARALGLERQVRFVPPQPHDLLSTYYRAADVCVVPRLRSRSASSPSKPPPAAPPWWPPRGRAHDPGRRRSHRVLVEGRDPADFARPLAAILADPGLAGALGRAGAVRAGSYTWAAAARALWGRGEALTSAVLVACG